MADPPSVSVLTLLVATNGALWLPDVLRGIEEQDHPSVDVLAVDNASDDGTREILERALGPERVVALRRRVGYGRALAAGLKVAVDREIDADAFLLLHDDAAMAPGTVSALARLVGKEEVGIAGAKLVEWDEPQRLQSVGHTTDRYGRIFNTLDRNELDQGQHDRPREVLYVSSACMMIARETIERVGLFDPRYVALRDDFDLCWRARLAGLRTVVTGEGSARHAVASFRGLRDGPVRNRSRYFGDRNVLATLVKNYGTARALTIVPVAFVLTLAGALLFALTGRERAARQSLEALQWNIVHLPATIKRRRSVQRGRVVADGELAPLMARGAPRLRGYVERALERVAGDVTADIDDEPGGPPPRVVDRLRSHPAAVVTIALLALWLVGARTIAGSGLLAGLDMPPMPASGTQLIGEYLSGWRSAGTGYAAPATPGLVVLGALQLLLFGSAWLAQRALLLGLPVLGAALMARLARAAGLSVVARRIAAVLYALSPLLLASFGAGRLADLVLLAAAPGLLLPVFRAGGLAAPGGWRSTAAGLAGLAIAASLSPWALVFVPAAAALLAGGLALSGAGAGARSMLARGAGLTLGAGVLLLPWTFELLRSGSPLGLGGPGPAVGMRSLLALLPGVVDVLPVAAGLATPLAVVVAVGLSAGRRRAAAAGLAFAAAGSVLVAWAVARDVPWIAPRASLPLAAAAVLAPLVIGLGIDAARERLSQRHVGGAHLVAAAAAVLLLAQSVMTLGWIVSGDRPGLVSADSLRPSFLAAESATEGAFRVLWLSGSAGNARISLSGPNGETMRTYAARRGVGGELILERVVAGLVSGGNEAAARMLGAFGVRYVIVRPDGSPSLVDAVERQADLRFAQRFENARVYRNEAAIPVAASIASPGWVSASNASMNAIAAAETGPEAGPGLDRTAPGALDGRAAKGARRLLLADDFSDRWELRLGNRVIEPIRSFDWATAFEIPGAGDVEVRWRGQWPHRAAIALQAALILLFAGAWSERAARERGER